MNAINLISLFHDMLKNLYFLHKVALFIQSFFDNAVQHFLNGGGDCLRFAG